MNRQNKKLILNIDDAEDVNENSLYVDIAPTDIRYYKYNTEIECFEKATENDITLNDFALVRLNQERCYEIILYK